MVTEESIREAYTFLRKNNHTIPDETLDFMLNASLSVLKGKQYEKPEDHVFHGLTRSGKKVWAYNYTDKHGMNHHSEPFDSKEEALKEYKEKYYLK